MGKIAFSLGDAAAIAAGPINFSATLRAGGQGGRSTFAAIINSAKAERMKVLHITESTWKDVLGVPDSSLLENSDQMAYQPLVEALKAGDGYVVNYGGGKTDAKIATEMVAAIAALRASILTPFNAVLGLGITNSLVIEELVSLAKERRVPVFVDEMNKTWATCLSNHKLNAYNHKRLSVYPFPFTALCPLSGKQLQWGLSGLAFAAFAAGVAQVTGSVGGYHLAPAGEKRGFIPRKNVQPLPDLGELNEEEFVKARLNKIDTTSKGQLMIGDCLSTHQQDDYARFNYVVNVHDAITRDYYSIAKQVQFEPDDEILGTFKRKMIEMLDGYVTSKALVKPRDKEDGDQEYILTLEQTELDLWTVKLAICVTGTARRMILMQEAMK